MTWRLTEDCRINYERIPLADDVVDEDIQLTTEKKNIEKRIKISKFSKNEDEKIDTWAYQSMGFGDLYFFIDRSKAYYSLDDTRNLAQANDRKRDEFFRKTNEPLETQLRYYPSIELDYDADGKLKTYRYEVRPPRQFRINRVQPIFFNVLGSYNNKEPKHTIAYERYDNWMGYKTRQEAYAAAKHYITAFITAYYLDKERNNKTWTKDDAQKFNDHYFSTEDTRAFNVF